MRILFTISNGDFGGKHRYMHQVMRAFADEGHAVSALVMNDDGIFLEQLAADKTIKTITANGSTRQGVLASLHTHGPFDIICTSGRTDSAVLKGAIEGLERRPLIIAFRHSAFPLDAAAYAFYEDSDLIVATSRQVAETEFSDLKNHRIMVLESGVDPGLKDAVTILGESAARKTLGIPTDAFVFLFAGRFDWTKGLDRAIKALADLSIPSTEACLVLVGHGPLRTELSQLAEEYGVSQQVHFRDLVLDIQPYLAAADCAVLPSVAGETGPLFLKEAMAAGLPVITSDIGGIPDFVRDGFDGFLIDKTRSLAESMIALIDDTALAETLGRNGQRGIIANHSWKQRLDGFLDSIENLYCRLRPTDAAAEYIWAHDVRMREENHGGFVFSPRTSELAEFDKPTYSALTQARSSDSLVGLPRALGDVKESEQLLSLLQHMKAVERRPAYEPSS
ncbi:glycosyltransferase family 4 protein [Pseudonocardia sp. HH130629-09]|uniref:glycosyltransferase family 4 protein n=1 Tax=Pseudonocardia sp. HH130629-09 TaxID=1641402 RepID=UPI0009E8C503|nr:glycosyltransferase family 4 protein [Pseudonocardia sp. HH130629-09]